MSDKKNLGISMFLAYLIEKGFEVSEVIRKPANVRACTLRLAVPPMVKGIDGIAFGDEVID
jgi:hypothetical protein